MQVKSLEDIITFTLGKNPTRIKDDEDVYTPEDFEKDLVCVNNQNSQSVCIINLMKSKAAPVSVKTNGKIISSNFLRCEFDEEVLEQW